jgi:hypothetical protein
LSSEFLSSAFSSLLECTSIVFCVCFILFSEVFHIRSLFLFNIFCFHH